MELGAGAGLVGLASTFMGASEVLLTDYGQMVPLLEHNAQCIAEHRDTVRSASLVWGGELKISASPGVAASLSVLPITRSARDGAGGSEEKGEANPVERFDVLVGSDLLYARDEAVYGDLVQ